MAIRVEPREAIAALDALLPTRQAEHVLFHPTRGTVVSVTNTALQEIDLATGALVGEIDFDVTSVVASATGNAVAASASDKVHVLGHITAVGSSAVVGVLYSRYLVVWDLHEHVLQSVTEVEKLQKSTTAVAASLCPSRWVFYASEGSASVKVTSVDSRDVPKKISRKAANRNSHITALAYSTAKRLLCCGSSDGVVQFWSFAEDNVLGGKDETASATLLFASSATQSPVVQLAFATAAANAHYLLAGYQSRTIEVWATFASAVGSSSKPRDPQRVAVTQLSPQQAVDFAKKSGVLSLSLHPQLPLLVAHWHSVLGSSSVIAWEFCPSIGGGSGASGSSGVLSEWCELIAASARVAPGGGGARAEEDASMHVAGVCWSQDTLVCYRSSGARSLFALGITDAASGSGSTTAAPLEGPSLCSSFALSFEQYWSYRDVPRNLMQITANPEPSSGAAEFVLLHASLQTGASEKLDDLPAWKNYQGKVLAPWTVVANHAQSVVCVKLRDRSKPQRSLRSAQHPSEDASFPYVVLEIKETSGGSGSSRRREDPDGEGGGGANFRVSCGSQLEALDLCFADFRSEEARQSRPWVLVVLASTGKSLCVQVKCDQVESSRILLQRDVLRVFSAPIPLSPQSPYSSVVGSRLLYVSADSADGRQVLQLSGDDLSVPHASAPGSWKTSGVDEAILAVTWNSSPAAAATASSDSDLLVAVRTTKRVVVLTKSLAPVQAYDLARDLAEPQSVLWMAQTLLFVTKHNHLRYVAPLRRDSPRSRLVCCLSETNRSAAQHTELLAVCGDRLAYAVTDVRTMESRVLLRPVSICEPLAAGFVVPNSKLRAIIEREVLVFALTGGAESSSPLTDHLLRLLYHSFGWKDTAMRLLDAVTNPPAGGGGSAVAATSGGSTSSSYPKSANLSAPLLASLYLDSHRWREFLKAFLASDPGLEEYAFAAEDSASSAKLPSRTGPLATKFRAFGRVLDALGQSELALKCFDLAGDDLAIVEMAREVGVSSASASALVASLQKDWAKLNPPLASLVSAERDASSADALARLESAVWRRHDLFSLLCCESLAQNERRSRLLATVKPFDARTVAAKNAASGAEESLAPCPRASVLPWKRLAPEDPKDWVGVSATPHFSSDEPKNPSYGFSASSSGALGAGGSTLPLGAAADIGEAPGGDVGAGASGAANASAKMTIGPFVDEEDAVVAYWRFEEGTSLVASDGAAESLDTSKRENNLQLLGLGTALSLEPSSAPVDKGEDGRVQDEYALRFAPSEASGALESECGAKCTVRSGSTLDIGFVFDDDPYRRKLTFEVWLRNFALAQQLQQHEREHEGERESGEFEAPSSTSTSQLADPESRTIVCRKSSASDQVWWSFSLVDGHLVLEFAGQSIKSDERVASAAAWHHAAFSVDVHSPKQAAVKLFLQGRCVGAKEVSGVDSVNAKIFAAAADAAAASGGALSYLHLGGSQLRAYEVTEVRVWAAARTQDQLSDMKENYLGIAEAKKRMKIAIHQRNCQCDKCHARRAKPAATKLGLPMLSTPFPSTPPASGSVRDRRRPPPK